MISLRVLNPFGNDSLTLFQMTKKNFRLVQIGSIFRCQNKCD